MNQNKKIAEKKSRPYQQECIDKVDGLKEGRFLIALATGLGKTWIFSHFKRYGRVLILSHRDELVNQPRRYFDCSFGVEKAENHSNGEEVVSASVQTLSHDSRLTQYKPDDFHTIIIDEAHHAAAPSYKKILNYFSGAKRVIGVTATPKRGDNVRLDDVFDEIIYAKDLRWGIENKYLSPIHCREVRAKYSLKGVKKSLGDFNVADLDSCITPEALASVAKVLADSLREERHILVYCTTVNTCELLKAVTDKLLTEEEQQKVAVLSGKTPEEERKDMLASFMDGNIRAIINCMVLTEGTDLPIADTIINFRPTCNASLYQQIVGRGTRLYDGKENCLCIDILPDDGSGTRNLCTTLSLFGVDASILDKDAKDRLKDEVDPLEISDEIAGRFAELAKAYEYRLEQVNRFIEEQEDVISSAREKQNASLNDLEAAVKEYNEKKKGELQDDYDFLGMDYSLMPDEEHRYCIKPTWNDKIYIAEPDVMGNTTITFDLATDGKKYYIGDMKIQEAIALAHDFCIISPDYMRYSWDSKLQKEWEEDEATPKQIGRLMHTYDGFEKGGLNKLQASGLIDFSSHISSMKREAEELRISPRMRDTTIEKKREAFEKKMEDDVKAKERGRAEFQQFRNKTERIAREKERLEEMEAKEAALREPEEPLQEIMEKRGVLPISMEFYNTNKGASDAQMRYIDSLKEEIDGRGILIETPYPVMSSKEASVYITILKALADNEVDFAKDGKVICFQDDVAEDVVKAFKKDGFFNVAFHYDVPFELMDKEQGDLWKENKEKERIKRIREMF